MMKVYVRVLLASLNRVYLLMVSLLALTGALTLAFRPSLGANTPLFEVVCWVIAIVCVCEFATGMVKAVEAYVLEQERKISVRPAWAPGGEQQTRGRLSH